MNATEQKELERIEWNLANCCEIHEIEAQWLISQLKAAQNKWQPIATAPKDGTVIIAVRVGFGPYITCYHEWSRATFLPTHWQPLPQPPKI